MKQRASIFIGKILWHSVPRRIGAYQWRAISYRLPQRYGENLVRSGYQFRRTSQFGSTPEQWTDAQDFPTYARYRPNYGLPQQLSKLWSETGDLIPDDMDELVQTGPERHLSKLSNGATEQYEQLGFNF